MRPTIPRNDVFFDAGAFAEERSSRVSADWTEHVGAYVDLYNETAETNWAGPAPAYPPRRSGPGYGFNGSCPEGNWPPSGKCGMTGPEEEYEEFKFKGRVLEIIEVRLCPRFSSLISSRSPSRSPHSGPRCERRRGTAVPLLHQPHRSRAAAGSQYNLAALRLHPEVCRWRLPVPPPDLPLDGLLHGRRGWRDG